MRVIRHQHPSEHPPAAPRDNSIEQAEPFLPVVIAPDNRTSLPATCGDMAQTIFQIKQGHVTVCDELRITLAAKRHWPVRLALLVGYLPRDRHTGAW
jgi:hypothetical protein